MSSAVVDRGHADAVVNIDRVQRYDADLGCHHRLAIADLAIRRRSVCAMARRALPG